MTRESRGFSIEAGRVQSESTPHRWLRAGTDGCGSHRGLRRPCVAIRSPSSEETRLQCDRGNLFSARSDRMSSVVDCGCSRSRDRHAAGSAGAAAGGGVKARLRLDQDLDLRAGEDAVGRSRPPGRLFQRQRERHPVREARQPSNARSARVDDSELAELNTRAQRACAGLGRGHRRPRNGRWSGSLVRALQREQQPRLDGCRSAGRTAFRRRPRRRSSVSVAAVWWTRSGRRASCRSRWCRRPRGRWCAARLVPDVEDSVRAGAPIPGSIAVSTIAASRAGSPAR